MFATPGDPAHPASSSSTSSGPERSTSSAAETQDSAPPPAAASTFGRLAPTADPITIGGQIYVRGQSAALEGQQIEDYSFGLSTLLDLYVDARPNDRVRGFVLLRTSYDPMLPDASEAVPSVGTMATDDGTQGSATISSLLGVQTNELHVLLDQLWLRFDLWRAIFVTLGRQHVRWGTAHIWAPTDFLHQHPRDPLDVFDARRGTDMLKLHLPIESTMWNFYAYAIADGRHDTATLYSVAGAARIELVLDSNELGVGALLRRGAKPKYAADLSMALGFLDLYGEVAVVDAGEIDRVGYAPTAMLPDPASSSSSMSEQILARIQQAVDIFYPVHRDVGYRPQVVGGLSYSQQYNDNDTFTIAVEYFYNGLGYTDPNVYPGLLFPHSDPLKNAANFFYLGKQYAALLIMFPGPFALDLHTFSLSTLYNISDRSCIARFDYAVQALTHLRIEAYVAGTFGNRIGEFRLGLETPPIDGVQLGRAPATFSMGIGLRVAI